MKKAVLVLIILLVCIAAVAGGVWLAVQRNLSEVPAEPNAQNVQQEEPQLSAAEETLQNMTLEEKVAQLFLLRPEALRLNETEEETGVTALNEELRQTLADYPVGGVVLFQQNIETPDQLSQLMAELTTVGEIPLFIGVDEEGGIVSRLANNEAFSLPQYESMTAIGATEDPLEARKMGETIGGYLREYGFNLDFAPDADVNTNPDNPVIGERAFGSDPQLVADMVRAAIAGFQSQNIMTCIKHFPGHGDTTADSHEGYVSLEKTWEELEKCELIPFRAAAGETDMIMVAHITMPQVTEDNLPASLSREMVTEKLRGELGYDGVVITDAMEMGAVADNYTAAESAVLALSAGVDLLLMPSDFLTAYEGVLSAVADGTLTEDRINESVLRVLELKDAYGLL